MYPITSNLHLHMSRLTQSPPSSLLLSESELGISIMFSVILFFRSICFSNSVFNLLFITVALSFQSFL